MTGDQPPLGPGQAEAHAGRLGQADGLVAVLLDAGELDFLLRFDPDRDRSASRADMVAVLEHFQAVLRDALPGGTP